MTINPILNTDSYKTSHFRQYPAGTEQVFSYVEARGGAYDSALFFGLQAILKAEFATPVTRADIDEAEDLLVPHGLPFNRPSWELLIDRHGGYFPLEIRAQPEGTIAPVRLPMMTVINTDPDFFWLTSYVETALLRVWYPITVATISNGVRKLIRKALMASSDAPDAELPFKLHDFGARGVSSDQSARLGGMAHLTNFQGTDTLTSLVAARRFYNEPMAGFSIPAAEHSTITSWGRNNEAAAYSNMVEQFGKPGCIFAVVSDSYDLFHAVEHIWGEQLRRNVIDSGATLVVRPDSGDPVDVVSKTVHLLARKFGTETNSKGYHVLKNVRVIQGDGVNPHSIEAILNRLMNEGFSASNIAFGMGGALLQKYDRDTMQFAYKASAAKVNGAWRDVYKDPVTDPSKRSKRGLLGLAGSDGQFHTVSVRDEDFQPIEGGVNNLEIVWRNGELRRDETLSEIRDRVATFDM
jgi:nicotinamide phosphoribosyltransferase